MSFIETPRFPVDLSYGSYGGAEFLTEIVRYQNGQEYRNSRWSIPLISQNIKYNIKTRTQALNVYQFFIAMQGRANGFRVKDQFDFTSNANGITAATKDDQSIGTGDGSTTTFQLKKAYTKGSLTVYRTIKKPVSGTVLVAKAGVLQTGGGVNYTIDTTTGIVTFTVAPANGLAITAGFEFDIPMRFDTDKLDNIEFEYNTLSLSTDIINVPDVPLMELRL